jgi:hypothetical protein
MNWSGCGRKLSWPSLRYYPGICLETLRKTLKNISQDNLSPGWVLNPRTPNCEAGVLAHFHFFFLSFYCGFTFLETHAYILHFHIYTNRTTQNNTEGRRQTSMPWAGFEPTIPVTNRPLRPESTGLRHSVHSPPIISVAPNSSLNAAWSGWTYWQNTLSYPQSDTELGRSGSKDGAVFLFFYFRIRRGKEWWWESKNIEKRYAKMDFSIRVGQL